MMERRALSSIVLRVTKRLWGDYDNLRVDMCVMCFRSVSGLKVYQAYTDHTRHGL
jgi:hypothetical protein